MQLTLTALGIPLLLERRLAVPDDKYANVVRGALGLAFRSIDCRPECEDPARCPAGRQCLYARLFAAESGERAASGLANPPRPFVLRVQSAPEGLTVGIHLFGRPEALVRPFLEAIHRVAADGLGPGRPRPRIGQISYLDASATSHPFDFASGQLPPPIEVSLAPVADSPARIRVHFLTATELKQDGRIARQMDFPILFDRLRDRILHYAAPGGSHSALALALAAQAARIETISESLTHVQRERLSTRTGQRHPLGGVIGHADYAGNFAHLWPWLRAAEWTGVGRQTVWGKGHIRCVRLD